MKLYHGTTEAAARAALEQGLVPRRDRDDPGNWDHSVDSNPDNIYLTTVYAGYFAANACKESDSERWGILEIDTNSVYFNLANLLPDEDFLEQALRSIDGSAYQPGELGYIVAGAMRYRKDMKDRTLWFREHLGMFQHMWQASIDGLGTCGHRGVISPRAITRAVIYDAAATPGLSVAMIDPTITLINYHICLRKYKTLTQWMMGGKIDPLHFWTLPAAMVSAEMAAEVEGEASCRQIEILKGETTP